MTHHPRIPARDKEAIAAAEHAANGGEAPSELQTKLKVLKEATFKGGGEVGPIVEFAIAAEAFESQEISRGAFNSAVRKFERYLDSKFEDDKSSMSKFSRKAIVPAFEIVKETLLLAKPAPSMVEVPDPSDFTANTSDVKWPITITIAGETRESWISEAEHGDFTERLAQARGEGGQMTAASTQVIKEMQGLIAERRQGVGNRL